MFGFTKFVKSSKFAVIKNNVNTNLVKMSSSSSSSSFPNPIEMSIRNKLTEHLQPHHVEVVNESYMHNVPKGSETHFKVLIVADKFSGMPLIKRHRLVNSILDEELKNGVHALSILAKTKEQWSEGDKITPSPNCRGGFGL